MPFIGVSGHECLFVYNSYPDLKVQHVLPAHPANCICIEFDPVGNYFATGSADALVSLWDVHELVCVRTLSRLDCFNAISLKNVCLPGAEEVGNSQNVSRLEYQD
jgi:WD40 repeat protein